MRTPATASRSHRRDAATRTFAGLAVVAALTVGVAACGSDDTDPGDPVEVPGDSTMDAPMDTEMAPMDTDAMVDE